MKRVLFYNRSFFGGGAEKVMMDYVRGLDKSKFDVSVMVRRDEGAFREQYYALEQEGVHSRRCCDWIKPGKNLIQKCLNYSLLFIADRCEFRFPGIFRRIAIRDEFDVEIAFMHNEAAAIVAASPNRKSKKFLWVHTDLRKITTWRQYFRTRKRQSRFFRRFDRVICVSNVAKQSVEELLGLKDTLTVLHNPVDSQRIITLSKEPCPISSGEEPLVCAVGRLSWEKNFSMLLRAHANLLQKGIVHRLCIVGEGPERETLETLIKELHLEHSATLVGHQSNPYPYLRAAYMTVCSSVYEGMHIVSKESLLLGTPVVSCCPVVSELFGDYACGIVTENNQAALEAAMEKMLTDTTFFTCCKEQTEKRSREFFEETPIAIVESLIETV